MKNKLVTDNFRGNIYVKKGKEVLIKYSGGYANLENKIENTFDTRFASASAGKVFVAVAILQLIDKGKLELSSTLGEIITDIDFKDIDTTITIEQLLTHTSGIPDYFDESTMEEYEDLWVDFPNYKIRRNRDLLPLFINKKMMYPKGEKFQYNNTGYVVLAMMIEETMGLLFDEYIKQNIFKNCGMIDSGYFELDRLPSRCASNYIYLEEEKSFRTNIYSVDAKGTGAGGAFITVNDIKLFWEGLLSYKLLSRNLTLMMLRKHVGNAEDGYYGYGVWIRCDEEKEIPYFQGLDPGVSFISEYDLEKHVMFILVSNYRDNVWQEVRNLRENLEV